MVDVGISIVLPAFNEAQSIAEVVRELRSGMPGAEIIVVDDGSSDKTAELARQAGANLVISHDYNTGYGASLKTGLLAAHHENLLFCDADGQHSLADVQKILAASDGYDMIVGARGRDSHRPFLRRPGKMIIAAFANHLAGFNIPDVNSGLRFFKKSVLLKYLHLMPNGFSFSTTSTFAFMKSNHRIKWVPITTRERSGKSSVRQLRHGMQTIMLMLHLTVLFEPLKIFLEACAVLVLLTVSSLVLDMYHEKEFNIGDTTVSLGLASMLVFLFGLLCDQVSAIRREMRE